MSQDLQLEQYAKTHNVRTIVMAIGANDYEFGEVVKRCVEDRLSSIPLSPNYCSDDSDMTSRFTTQQRDQKTQLILEAMHNIVYAMREAGYTSNMFNIIVQDYWSAIPDSPSDFTDAEAGANRWIDGCPVWDQDATWLNDTVLNTINSSVVQAEQQFRMEPAQPKATLLDVSHVLVRHRLCEKGTSKVMLPYPNGPSWDRREWVSELRVAPDAPYTVAEGGHANYWGQLAERNCLRQAYNHGNPLDGSCQPIPHLDQLTSTRPNDPAVYQSEPRMEFDPVVAWPIPWPGTGGQPCPTNVPMCFHL